MTEHVDPYAPYFLTGMLIFAIGARIWMHYEGRKLDKEIDIDVRPRKDIRIFDLEKGFEPTK